MGEKMKVYLSFVYPKCYYSMYLEVIDDISDYINDEEDDIVINNDIIINTAMCVSGKTVRCIKCDKKYDIYYELI